MQIIRITKGDMETFQHVFAAVRKEIVEPYKEPEMCIGIATAFITSADLPKEHLTKLAAFGLCAAAGIMNETAEENQERETVCTN